MKVSNLKAEANPRGGRIDLSWVNPSKSDFPEFKGVKILRRENTFPTSKDIDTEKEIHDYPSDPGEDCGFTDKGLKPETIYYYTVVTYDDELITSNEANVSAMATATYRTADELYNKLPTLYKRYDTILPRFVEKLDPTDKNKGQLGRFVEMFGLQFDLMRSFASGMRNFSNVDHIDGTRLPLLAKWIGWKTDFTLTLAQQRNEIKYAPHFYRTTGTAPNLQAMINRVTDWDVRIKEFVHNILLSNDPEQLTIWEKERRGAAWEPSDLLTLDVAYEGRPAAIQTDDGRQWIFYHARQRVPRFRRDKEEEDITKERKETITEDHWHIWCKIHDHEKWGPARRLTFAGDINKYPNALQKSDGNIWLFWSKYEDAADERMPQIRLNLLAAGRPAWPAEVQGAKKEPFAFKNGNEFKIIMNDGTTSITRVVTFYEEHFQNIQEATAKEAAALLDREVPGVEVLATDEGTVNITSFKTGQEVTLTVPASEVANKLGLVEGSFSGSDAVGAHLIGSRQETFALEDGDTMCIRIDTNPAKTIVFKKKSFQDIGHAEANEVIAEIKRDLPGIADIDNKKIKLKSPTAGETSRIAVEVDSSTAALALGFGVPVPQAVPAAYNLEPTPFEDNAGNIWLFWSSRRKGVWKIWYNCFNGTSWGSAKPLTTGLEADHEPAAIFDPDEKKIWVFWSRKKANGLWNIFYRTRKNLDFNSHPDSATESADATWSGVNELKPVLTEHDKKDPAPVLMDTDKVEIFYSSNCIDGWNIWSKILKSGIFYEAVQITTDQFTNRTPVVLKKNDIYRLLLRSNRSQIYKSTLYPDATTVDSRYSGSISLDTRNHTKIRHRRNIQDIQHYTYDTGRGANNLYARDTIGIFFVPDTLDQQITESQKSRLTKVLNDFLPTNTRIIFVPQPNITEYIYCYDIPVY